MAHHAAVIARRNGKGEVRVYLYQLRLEFDKGIVRHIPFEPDQLLAAISGEVGIPYVTKDATFVTSTYRRGLKPSLTLDDLSLVIRPVPSVVWAETMIVSWKAVVRALFRKHPDLSDTYSEREILASVGRRKQRPALPPLQ